MGHRRRRSEEARGVGFRPLAGHRALEAAGAERHVRRVGGVAPLPRGRRGNRDKGSTYQLLGAVDQESQVLTVRVDGVSLFLTSYLGCISTKPLATFGGLEIWSERQ